MILVSFFILKWVNMKKQIEYLKKEIALMKGLLLGLIPHQDEE